MKRIVIIALLVLGACKSTPERPPWWQGASLDDVIKQMRRYPDAQRQFEDVVIYSWSVDQPEAHLIVGRVHQQCTMDVNTRNRQVISIGYNGSSNGCGYLEADLMRDR